MMDTIGDVPEHGAMGRRRWPDAAKRRIVGETLEPGASVSVVARRHDVNANLVFTWRRQYRDGLLSDDTGRAVSGLDLGMVPVRVATEAPTKAPPVSGSAPARRGPIEIALPNGCCVRVDREVDAGALRHVLRALGWR
jgi:transposase